MLRTPAMISLTLAAETAITSRAARAKTSFVPIQPTASTATVNVSRPAPKRYLALALATVAIVLLVCVAVALIFAPESDPTLILGQSTGDLWWLAYGGSLSFGVAATAVGAVEQAGRRRARSIGFWIGLVLSVLLVAGLVSAGIAALLSE